MGILNQPRGDHGHFASTKATSPDPDVKKGGCNCHKDITLDDIERVVEFVDSIRAKPTAPVDYYQPMQQQPMVNEDKNIVFKNALKTEIAMDNISVDIFHHKEEHHSTIFLKAAISTLAIVGAFFMIWWMFLR